MNATIHEINTWPGLRVRDWQSAIDVQCASNSSGIIRSLSELTSRIWNEANKKPGRGTEWVNRHPIIVLYTTQLMHLAEMGMADQDTYHWCYLACQNAAVGKPTGYSDY